MKVYVESTLNDVPTDLISIATETSADKETGEVINYVKAEVEVPKGYDALGTCKRTNSY